MAECCKSLKSSITSKWPDNTEALTLKKNGPAERAAGKALLLRSSCWHLVVGFLQLMATGIGVWTIPARMTEPGFCLLPGGAG